MRPSVALGSALFGVAATAILLAALPNCSSGKDTTSTTGACVEYVDALLAFSTRCGRLETTAETANVRERYGLLCSKSVSAPGAGDLEQALRTCSAQLVSADCGSGITCDLDVKGSLPDGAKCLGGYQCAGGGCDVQSNQCGTCGTLAAVGQPCTLTLGCVKDAECSLSGGGNSGTCRAVVRAKAGESCRGEPGGPPVRCETDLICEPEGATSTCVARGALDAACTSASGCQSNLVCRAGRCAERPNIGEPCDNAIERCRSGAACVDKKCVPIVYVETGESCNDGPRRCRTGECKGGRTNSDGGVTPGVCEARIPDGQPCRERDASALEDDPPECDIFAKCIDGICQLPDPARCQ